MANQLVMRHLTNSMDKVATVQVLKPILIRVMSVQATVEVVRRGVLDPVLITSILRGRQDTWSDEGRRTYSVFFFIKYEGGDDLTSIGVRPSLSMNADGSTANAEVVDSAGNGVRRGRH